MKDKEKLNKLLIIIGDLLKIDGNEWLVDGLLEKINESSPVEEIAKHSIIQNIHEYCVEQKIDKQANDFYKDFKIEKIKFQLIEDYKKMEHERRRDDFQNFCLCVYQQIENVTNYLFENYVYPLWNQHKNKVSIKSFYDINKKQYTFPNKEGVKLERLVFMGSNDPKWYANRKFRAVLYFFYFNKEIIRDEFKFNSIYFTNEDVYRIRNQNHRGGNPTEYQKKMLNKIKDNEAKYYFKFYGFLQDFMSEVNNNIRPDIKQNLVKNKGHKKIKTKVSSTLGDDPKLKEIFDKLKNKK